MLTPRPHQFQPGGLGSASVPVHILVLHVAALLAPPGAGSACRMERPADRLHPGCFLPATRREIVKGGGPGLNRAVSRQRTTVRQLMSLRPTDSQRQAPSGFFGRHIDANAA